MMKYISTVLVLCLVLTFCGCIASTRSVMLLKPFSELYNTNTPIILKDEGVLRKSINDEEVHYYFYPYYLWYPYYGDRGEIITKLPVGTQILIEDVLMQRVLSYESFYVVGWIKPADSSEKYPFESFIGESYKGNPYVTFCHAEWEPERNQDIQHALKGEGQTTRPKKWCIKGD